MAWQPVGASLGWFLTVSLADQGGQISTLEYMLKAIDYATAQASVTAILAQIGNVTQSSFSSYSLSQRYMEDSLAYPGAAQNEIKATIIVNLTGGTKKATLNIPAPTNGLFVAATGPNSDVLDTLDADVIAYVALYAVGGSAYISDGEDADFVVRGRKTSRRNGLRA